MIVITILELQLCLKNVSLFTRVRGYMSKSDSNIYVVRWRPRWPSTSRRGRRGSDRATSKQPPASTAHRQGPAGGQVQRAARSVLSRALGPTRTADQCPAAADQWRPARRRCCAAGECNSTSSIRSPKICLRHNQNHHHQSALFSVLQF